MLKKTNKILAAVLIFTLTFANWIVLGEAVGKAIAINLAGNLESQNAKTNVENVEFDAYFEKNGTKMHTATQNLDEQAVLSLDIEVEKGGYLKDAQIDLSDIEKNYEIRDINNSSKSQDEKIGKLEIKQVNAEEMLKLSVALGISLEEKTDLAKLNSVNTVTLKGTYVNSEGKEQEVEKKIRIGLLWQDEAKLEIEQEYVTYADYKTEEAEGTILQSKVKLAREADTKNLPIEETTLKIKANELQGKKLVKVLVDAVNTELTNGKTIGEVNFTEDNWSYNEETNEITITVKNEIEDQKVWSGEGKDEYLITFIYENEEEVLEEQTVLGYNIEASLKEYNKEELVEAVLVGEVETAKTQELQKIELQTNTNEISKGKIYANRIAKENNYEISYETKLMVNVPYAKISDEIKVNMPEDTFYNKDGEMVSANNVSYYKSSKISKVNFEEILGEEGYITVLSEGAQIGQISLSSTENENGELVLEYDENISSIVFEASKPVKEGSLKLINEKVLNNDVNLTNEELVSIDKIETSAENEKAQINLTETKSNITVEIDRTELSSVAENKDVTFTVELNNRDENTNLYKNPTVDIVLPENVETVNIKQADILYAEGIIIKDTYQDIVDGKPVIHVILEGVQNEFSSGALTGGTNIVIKADIKLKELTPNTKETIEINCQNQNEIAKMLGLNLLGTSQEVTLTAPEEVISINTIKTDDEGQEITSIDQGTQTGKLEILDEAKTKQMELKVLNNYKEPIQNIVILGRIPAKGNKTPEGIDLGSNFTTKLANEIESKVEGAEIYYSENENALNALDLTWKKASEIDLENAKSYLIVFPEDYTLEPAQSLTFAYNFNIPEMLEHNSSTYGTFTTYYNKIEGDSKVAQTSLAEIVGLSTGAGPQLKLELNANVEQEAVVREGQRIEFTAKVTNTGNEPVTNAIVKVCVPGYMKFVEYDGERYVQTSMTSEKLLTIENLAVGENKTFTIDAKVSSLPTIEEYYKDVKKDGNGYYIEKLDKIALIEISEEGLEELKSKNTSYVKSEATGKYYYSEEYNVEELLEQGYKMVTEGETYYAAATKKEYIEEYIPLITSSTVTADRLEKEIKSNEIKLKGAQGDIDIFTAIDINSLTDTIREGDTIKHNISITNTNENTLNNVILDVDYSDALQYEEMYIVDMNQEQIVDSTERKVEGAYNNNKIQYTIQSIAAGETLQFKIVGTAKELQEEYEKEMVITPKVTVGNIVYTGDPMKNKVAKANLTAMQTSSAQNSYIKEGDIYTYEITLENEGTIATEDLSIQLNIPEELLVKDMYYTIGDQKVGMAKLNKQKFEKIVNSGETLKIVITVQALKLAAGLTEKEITNLPIITEADRNIEINSVSHTIETNPNWDGPDVFVPGTSGTPENPDNPNNPSSPSGSREKTFKISGFAWEDKNRDGKYDGGEELLPNISVYLISEAGDILKETKTDTKGSYTFTDLEKGKYIVAFAYDNNTYGLTYYKKDGIAENLNSDVIGDKGNAITDTIEITDTSIGNISMGLVIKETFDLKLDKFVSKLVAQTSNGTKTYAQKDGQTLAKIDIRSKELNGAKVIMEYEIVVTNEGKTAGYAKEIVDYIPKDTEFSSELNDGWYLGKDGNLHTTALKDTVIEPGESKSVKLVLTRNMTQSNTGTVNNRAEIENSNSVEQVEDIDSIGANKVTSEDDIGSADIIIGVATGREVIYVTLGLICIIILGTGIYFIKKKVLM